MSDGIDLDDLDKACAATSMCLFDMRVVGGLIDRIRELEDLAIDYRSLAADEGYPRRAAYITGIIEKGAVRRG